MKGGRQRENWGQESWESGGSGGQGERTERRCIGGRSGAWMQVRGQNGAGRQRAEHLASEVAEREPR